MESYQFESELDNLLGYFNDLGPNNVVLLGSIPDEFNTQYLHKQISILLAKKLIISPPFDFNDGKHIVFPNLYSITHEGVNFFHSTSFIEQAKISKRAQRRYNFEYYKIGYDSVIAILSLGVSICALYLSLKK